MKKRNPKQANKKRKYRDYQYPGHDVGQSVAFWLNGPPHKDWNKWDRSWRGRFGIAIGGTAQGDSKGRRRVIRLLDTLHEIERLFQVIRQKPDRPDHEVIEDLRCNQDSAQGMLQRYLSSPGVAVNEPYREGNEWRFFHGNRSFVWAVIPKSKGYTGQEFWAVTTAIRELADLGLLNRLRHCRVCGKFFYAIRPEGTYCGQTCRAKARKEWRDEYDQNRK